MSLSQSVYSRWNFEHDGAKSCLITSLGTTMKSHLEHGSYVGWKDKETKTFVQELAQAGGRQCFTGDTASKRDRIERRQLVNPNFDPDLLVPGIKLGYGGWNDMAAGSCAMGADFAPPRGLSRSPVVDAPVSRVGMAPRPLCGTMTIISSRFPTRPHWPGEIC
jgi:hypothetical protein